MKLLPRITIAFGVCLCASAAFADGTINTLTPGTALSGTEQIPMFQGSNPAVTTTPNAIKTFVGATTISTGCQATGGSFTVPNGTTATANISVEESTNAQTGAGYTTQATDCGKLVTLSNAGAQTLTLNNLSANQFFDVLNIGAGTWTISAGTGSIIGGPTSLTQNQGARIVFDGTNWHVLAGAGSGSAPTQTITAGTNITTSGTCSGTALSCTVNSSGGGSSNGVVTIAQSNYWMNLLPTQSIGAGPTLSANTQYCFVGYVSATIVTKQLGATVTTANAGATVQLGLYSIANAAGVTTWTFIDHTATLSASGSTPLDVTGAYVGHATNTLSPGTMYGLCVQTGATAAIVMQSINGAVMSTASEIGSKTLDNANRAGNNLVGYTKSGITIGTWSTQTLNSGSGDMSESDSLPLISFLVN